MSACTAGWQPRPPLPPDRRLSVGERVMRLYHVPGSRSTRVLWMLEEIGAPYELIAMTREERKTAGGLVWSFFAMKELEPPIFQSMRARREESDETEQSERYDAAAAVLDAALSDRDWLLGPFTVADVIFAGVAGIPSRRTHLRARTGSCLRRAGTLPPRQPARR